MALLDALGAHLQTAGVGTLGTDLFLAQFQDSPDLAVVVMEAQGFDPIHTFGSSISRGDRPRVRVVCRAALNDYPAARSKAEQVRAVLGAIRAQTIAGTTFGCVLDSSGIYPLGYDREERPLLAIDFIAWVDV